MALSAEHRPKLGEQVNSWAGRKTIDNKSTVRLSFGPSYLTPLELCVFLTVLCLIPRIPNRLMEAYTRISLPVNKLNVSSPEGDDKKEYFLYIILSLMFASFYAWGQRFWQNKICNVTTFCHVNSSFSNSVVPKKELPPYYPCNIYIPYCGPSLLPGLWFYEIWISTNAGSLYVKWNFTYTK
jgi:hypothetical protein